MLERGDRRQALQALVAGVGAFTMGPWAGERASAQSDAAKIPVTGESHAGLAPFDELMTEFVRRHKVPGAALAVTRHGKLVYSRGFGLAEKETERPVQPNALFRLASISKPITAVGVMRLIEQSKFGLDDRVFEILPAKAWLPDQHDERLRSITVRHLLQHTSGWDREKSFDPIGRVRAIAQHANKSLPVSVNDVIRYTLTLPLDFDPGARYAYYNVDYLILGRLIEHATGQPYEAWVKQHVLAPIGVTRMQLSRAWKEDLAQDEVCYYDSKHREQEAVNGKMLGTKVPVVYGGENIEAYEAHGGWIGSAVDLVYFASAFDDVNASKLLKAESIREMWSRPAGIPGHDADGKPKDVYYGCGWNVRPVGYQGRSSTWHNGLIAGTSTILVRRHDGLNWAVLFNTDADAKGKTLSGLVDPLVHQAEDAVKRWE